MPVDAADVGALVALAERLKPDLTVVGPEAPLVAGIRNKFECRGMRLVGPSQRDARLEGSKIYAKQFMDRYGIPTPTLYGDFESPMEAIRALDAVDWPVVIKADGLCAGKGVLVAETRAEAEAFIRRLMQKHELGAGGSRVLLEHALKGDELSFIVLTDGRSFVPDGADARPQASLRRRPRPQHRRDGRVHHGRNDHAEIRIGHRQGHRVPDDRGAFRGGNSLHRLSVFRPDADRRAGPWFWNIIAGWAIRKRSPS